MDMTKHDMRWASRGRARAAVARLMMVLVADLACVQAVVRATSGSDSTSSRWLYGMRSDDGNRDRALHNCGLDPLAHPALEHRLQHDGTDPDADHHEIRRQAVLQRVPLEVALPRVVAVRLNGVDRRGILMA